MNATLPRSTPPTSPDSREDEVHSCLRRCGERDREGRHRYALLRHLYASCPCPTALAASSTGLLLKMAGFKVTAIKIDPYMNIDAGTMAPTEHGEFP